MQKINFQNLPNTTTPINETNMNLLQDNVEDVFDGNDPMGNIVVDGISNKNLIDGWFSGGIDSTTGEDTTSTTSFRTNYMEVDFSSNNYYISGLPSSSYRHFVAAYNANKQFLGRTGASIQGTRSLNSGSFTSGTPQGTGDIKYIKITVYDNVPEGNLKNAQMEKGSSATNFTEGKSYGYISGSNTNGSYIKYDDGTLICWHEVTTSVAMTESSAGFYRSGFISPFPNFPITFTSRPQMFVSSQSQGQYISFLLKGYPPSTTNPNDLRLYGTWSSTQNMTLSYIAIGRWR